MEPGNLLVMVQGLGGWSLGYWGAGEPGSQGASEPGSHKATEPSRILPHDSISWCPTHTAFPSQTPHMTSFWPHLLNGGLVANEPRSVATPGRACSFGVIETSQRPKGSHKATALSCPSTASHTVFPL
jgi:hypothetical protein